MENGAHALQMAFAILVFVLAITIAFATFSQAKEVADVVLYYNDKTNFDEYVSSVDSSTRIVGLEVMVPLIRNYIYANGNYSIEVRLGSETIVFDIIEQKKNGYDGKKLIKYRDDNLEKIIRQYSGRKFKEIFSEYVQVGKEIELTLGESIEKINTLTKTKITFILQ